MENDSLYNFFYYFLKNSLFFTHEHEFILYIIQHVIGFTCHILVAL